MFALPNYNASTRLTWQSLYTQLQAVHIPGHTNVIADALSRSRLQAFRRLRPAANQNPKPCPTLAEIILN